jgi:hypothetical protein
VIFVVDAAGARHALTAGLLSCPDCPGRLGPWWRARTRRLRGVHGPVELTPDRARCRSCRRTHVLLPAFALPRRAYTAEVVGGALLAAGRRGSGEVAARTARAWRAQARDAAAGLVVQAGTVAAAFGASIYPDDGPAVRHDDPLTGALDALGRAGRAFVAAMPVPPRPQPGALSGVDYLALLQAEHRRDLACRLRLADPDRCGRLAPWPTINIITGGRLLTTPPDR